ncbi:MAG: acetoacetate--CoA ligase [Gammaproteobacteria bacterium]|nr:acetoacetate--CoA ligase [Gammaproteobacteria bacterium]
MKLLWEPSADFQRQTNMTAYMNWLADTRGLKFADYAALQRWSVAHLEAFWQSIWDYYRIQSTTPVARVLSSRAMPGAQWFAGASLNFAEHIFRGRGDDRPALLAADERHDLRELSWAELEARVASVAGYLRGLGVVPGDRVVAYLPNIPEALIAFLAASAIGAVWSSCSPDFGTNSVVDRFQQIAPKVLIAVDGYGYNGKTIDRVAELGQLQAALPSLERILLIDHRGGAGRCGLAAVDAWDQVLAKSVGPLHFESLPFDHPLWVLYSSGTTGIPKAITHSHGGVLLEQLKHLGLHCDVKPGDRFFWYSTTGWVMWNIGLSVLLLGAVPVIYDGNPAYPDQSRLWSMAERARLTHFGTGAAYLIACMKAGLKPGSNFDLKSLRVMGSTGSPLPEEAFEWVYHSVKPDLWLLSMSGGTDIASAFVGGCPLLRVHAGEIQCALLGVDVRALDEAGNTLVGEVGEMVVMEPMPSMPIYFWNDADDRRYRESYFEDYPGRWRHGDWMRVSAQGTIQILGRSDSTLNRGGVRIGTSEVYRGVELVDAVADSLAVSIELPGGGHYLPLFVQLKPGFELNADIKTAINQSLRANFSPRHVPDAIFQIDEVPYTLTGKKMETPVKKILMGVAVEKAANRDAMKNPASLDYFLAFAARMHKELPSR